MPNFVSNTITVQGEGQIAAAMAKIQMVITRVQVGSGVANVPLAGLTTLIAPIMNLTPQPPQVSANNLQTGEVVVMAVLDTANVTSIFNLAELGVWATSGGGPEQLIAYCQCSSPFDSIAPGSGQNRLQLNLQIPIVVGVGASVSITVQAGNPVYVPPVVAGPGIVVNAPTNSQGQVIEWIVSTPQITQNTTLYVANEYTQNVAPYFSSLQNAINYLNSFVIASGVQVTITLAAEQFNSALGTYIYHANASQIVIQGAINPDVNFSSLGSITGSAGNWKVQLRGVSSTKYIKVGTWLNIYYVGFDWMQPLVAGCYQVTAVSGSTVTIQTYYYNSAWPSGMNASGTMTPLTTVLNITGTTGQIGLDIANGIGLFQNIAIVNTPGQSTNYATYGLLVSKGNAYVTRVGVWGFRSNILGCMGFAVSGPASGILSYCTSTFNDNGFIAGGGGSNTILIGCCATHNLNIGIWAESGGSVICRPDNFDNYTNTAGNRDRGLLAENNSMFGTEILYTAGVAGGGTVMSSYNASYGCHIYNRSMGGLGDSTAALWASFNGNGYDVVLNSMSLFANSGWIQGTRRFNVVPGVMSADGCLMQ